MKIRRLTLLIFLTWTLTSCISIDSHADTSRLDFLIANAVRACSLAELELVNSIWDPETGLPLDKELDHVHVMILNEIDYYIVTIGVEHIYPDAPSAQCHVEKETGRVLMASFSAGDPGNSQLNGFKQFYPYSRLENIETLDKNSITHMTLSLRETMTVNQNRLEETVKQSTSPDPDK